MARSAAAFRQGRGIANHAIPMRLGPAVAALAGVVLLVALIARGGGDTHPSAAAVQAYQQGITQPVMDWGKIEVLGMRPALADLESGQGVPAVTIAGEAAAWHEGLVQIRDRLRSVRPAPGLEGIASGFDLSINDYIQASDHFAAAARASGTERQSQIDQGLTLVKSGDRSYNEASMKLQQARRAAGLGTTPDFPDHPAAGN